MTTENFQRMKEDLWRAAETKVRECIAAMPDAHKPRLKEIAEQEFKPDLEEIAIVKARFQASPTLTEAGHFSGRYAVLYRQLCKRVSLHLLGVKFKTQASDLTS